MKARWIKTFKARRMKALMKAMMTALMTALMMGALGCQLLGLEPASPGASDAKAGHGPSKLNPIKRAEDEVQRTLLQRQQLQEQGVERSLRDEPASGEPADGIYRRREWAGPKPWAGSTAAANP